MVVVILFLLLIISNLAYCQDQPYQFHNLSIEHGLSNRTINSICQDHKGYMWMGTGDGLNRYDAYKFAIYRYSATDSCSLSSSSISFIYEDSHRRLWIGTPKGLCLYNREKDCFTRFLHDENDSLSLGNDLVSDITEDSSGNIWIAYYGGFAQIKIITNKERQTGKISFINKSIGINGIGSWIYTLCADNDKIWLGNWTGKIFQYNCKTEKLIASAVPIPLRTKCNTCNRIKKIRRLKNGDILFCLVEGKGAYIYKQKSDELKKIYSLSNNIQSSNTINDAAEDKDGLIWFATEYGLWIYSPDKDDYFPILPDYKSKNSLSGYQIRTLYFDKNNAIWIGTVLSGINYCNKNAPSFELKKISYNDADIHVNQVSTMVKMSDSKYFIMTNAGLYLYSTEDQSSKCYHLTGQLDMNGGKIMLANNEGLKIYDRSMDAFILYPKLSNLNIYKLIVVKSGDIWFRIREKGFCFYDFKKDKSYYYPDSSTKEPTINNLRSGIDNVFQDNNKDTWITTHDGLYKLTDWSGKLVYNSVRPENPDSLPGGISCAIVDSMNNFWLGTVRNGLVYFNRSANKFKTYSVNDGLQSNNILDMVKDNSTLWIICQNGISQFDLRNRKFYNYSADDGIPSIDFTGHCMIDNKGMLYAGTLHGIICLSTRNLIRNTIPPTVVISDFRLFNKSVPVLKKGNNHSFALPLQISEMKKIILNYYQNVITIEYAALNYTNSSKNQYSYKLEGFDADWNYTERSRTVTYTNLDPGNYIFKVKASNNDGVWNESPTELQIIVLPPFWKTIWFRSLMVLLILSAFAIFYLMRTNAILKQKRLLERQVRERTAEVVSQKEEIQSQADNLREVNNLLKEHQIEIETQAEELSKANVELNKLNATKDKFFSIIAHDLKNPFQAILGFSDILLNDFGSFDKKEVLEFIKSIKESSKSAYGLLENLLQWARSQTNQIMFTPTSFRLYDVAKENFSLLKLNAEKKSISLINKVPQSIAAYADQNMITTVVRNLVNNAVKFTPEKGSITISASAGEQTAELIIEDNGVGMDARTKDKLFRMDQHYTTKGTSGEHGTGLGLIICMEFLQKNNGSIRVESEPGKGSRFIICLKKSDEELKEVEESATPAPETEKKPFAAKKESEEKVLLSDAPIVLLVEDQVEIRKAVRTWLEKTYRVVEAGNGEEGLAYAMEIIPNLIVSDWMMPGMNGIDFCKRIKLEEFTSHIPVIILTSQSKTEHKVEGYETGADDYLTKPVEAPVLLARIKNLLLSREKLKEKYLRENILTPQKIESLSVDERFMQKAVKVVEQYIDNPDFGIDLFASGLGMSRSQLDRKFIAITGKKPNEFIRYIRLKRAAQLLEKKGVNVSEVMYQVGFNSRAYFAKSFKEIYNLSPSEYANKFKT